MLSLDSSLMGETGYSLKVYDYFIAQRIRFKVPFIWDIFQIILQCLVFQGIGSVQQCIINVYANSKNTVDQARTSATSLHTHI